MVEEVLREGMDGGALESRATCLSIETGVDLALDLQYGQAFAVLGMFAVEAGLAAAVVGEEIEAPFAAAVPFGTVTAAAEVEARKVAIDAAPAAATAPPVAVIGATAEEAGLTPALHVLPGLPAAV